eukprot:837672-Alexandrium_andersonii.AAC.1
MSASLVGSEMCIRDSTANECLVGDHALARRLRAALISVQQLLGVAPSELCLLYTSDAADDM